MVTLVTNLVAIFQPLKTPTPTTEAPLPELHRQLVALQRLHRHAVHGTELVPGQNALGLDLENQGNPNKGELEVWNPVETGKMIREWSTKMDL